MIPIFNEEKTLSEVLSELKSHYPNIIAVDDGSFDDSKRIIERFDIVSIYHPNRKGQGAALRSGIKEALSRNAQVIVTFDGDGQHQASDIEQLVKPIQLGLAEVSLGSRFIGQTPGLPLNRRFLLKGGILFTQFHSGLKLTDTHNGLRAFSAKAAREIEIRQNGMAHASEILQQIAKRRIAYCEVPVTIRYSDGDKSIGKWFSIFSILWSLCRASVLPSNNPH